MALADRALGRGSADDPPGETVLLERARRGDATAFEAVVRRHQRRVYGVALRIVRSHPIADDIAQGAFVRAWQSLASFELGRPFGPWVSRIAANLALNHLRSPRSREQTLGEDDALERSPRPGPLAAVLDAEAQRVLDDAVASLPAEQRAVLVLRVYEEMSYAEIAEALELPAGTVMSRLSRARDQLARALTPYLGAATLRGRGGAR